MTQNLTSSSLSSSSLSSDLPSTGKPDYDKQSSSEIRADIDQTRASVGDKIDQLQARLDPNRLKQQAQDTVQEMLNDTASSMTDYVKTHKDEMVTSLADAARRNPLPTALIGLGVGWLILESMAGSRPRQERREERDYRGSSGRDARYVPADEGYYPTSNWRPSDYSSASSSRIPANDSYRSASAQGFSSGYGQQGSGQQGYSQQGYRQEARPNSGMSSSGNGHQQGENPISKATDAVKDTVSDLASRAGDVASDIKDKVGDTMSDAMNSMGNYVGDAAGDMRDRFNDTMGGMGHQANEMGRQGQRQLDRGMNQMDQWQQQARYEGQRRGQQVARNLEDNPLIYGALALAAGAALAMLLPQSHVENRAFGEMRDQMMARGGEMLDTAKGHAQQVFEEVRPDLEQTARQIVSDVTETGKQAVKDAADQLSPVVDKAMTKGKEEARSAAKEIGVDPDKLTAGNQSSGSQMSGSQSSSNQMSGSQSSGSQSAGSQMSGNRSSGNQMSGNQQAGSSTKSSQVPVLNRDTLSGQWKQVKGEVKRKWGQLSDDDMMRIEGDYDKLVGALQTRYGYTREHVERELSDFFKSQTA